MNRSYFRNYLKIYVWQGSAIVANMLSMFIIVPRISGQPHIYGIYTLCVSLSLYLSYADLGFVSAGYKYASESFSRNDLQEEISYIGFVNFVLIVFVTIFSLAVIFFSWYPGLLFKSIGTPEDEHIASELLLILAVFSYGIVLQRILQIVFGVRLEDFVYQRINIIGSLVKIASVFYFFPTGKYDIVGFYLFSQIVTVTAGIVSLWVIKTRYHYDLRQLVKKSIFSREVYRKTKSLALGSLFLVFSWVLYYELDPIVIGKLFGPRQIAIYAIGLTTISFLRTAFATFYAPFNARFNHFVGNRDHDGLKAILTKLLSVSLPITVLPLVSLILLMKPFVLSWVGPDYLESVVIGQFLVMSYLFSFISYPAGILIIALENIRKLYIINSVIVVVYWTGIALTINSLSIESFAMFKFVAFMIAGIFNLWIILHYLETSLAKFAAKFLTHGIVPLIMATAILLFVEPYLPTEKGRNNLLIVIGTGGVVTLLGSVIYYSTSGVLKDYAGKFLMNSRSS